ncbi:MAG: hypothetical protein F7B61_03275 [Caldisphaeraceae archaeon]|nr:hypothetical protein [Caldisphaeraceae archaeon]
MNAKLAVMVATIALLILLLTPRVAGAYSMNCNETLNEIQNAYKYIAKASSLGYNVSSYEEMLNTSINYYNTAINTNNTSLCKASLSVAKNVSNSGDKIVKRAEWHHYYSIASKLAYVFAFSIISYLLYRFSPLIFWKLWIKAHEGYEVKEK